MRAQPSRQVVLVGALSLGASACSSDGTSDLGANQSSAGTSATGAITSGSSAGTGATTGTTTAAGTSTTGSTASNAGTGTLPPGTAAGGSTGTGTSTGDAGGAGTSTGTTGRAGTTGSGEAAAGASNVAGSGAGGTLTSGEGCVTSDWPTADPLTTGPFTVVTENDVGPEAGVAEDDGTVPRFTLFRPETLGEGGRCHPLITWGNGTGSTPNLYRSILGLFASHGFVVIASNNENVGQGDPRPMIVGVDWVLEQNEDPSSELYNHIDVARIGATGHSQGAFATSQASGDPRITTNVPIEGSQPQRNLSGPAMFFCGGLDDIVGCDGAMSALNAVDTLPAMYAEYVSVDHGSWLGRGSTPSVVEGTINAWMRVHLMGDESLKSWFYGDDCQLCTDDGWVIEQKNMGL